MSKIRSHKPSPVGLLLGVLFMAGCAQAHTGLPDPEVRDGGTGSPDEGRPGGDAYLLFHDGPPLADAGPLADGACVPEGERKQVELQSSAVSTIDGVTYSSNPPSSGPHCATAAALGGYPRDAPAARCHWLASLAQGAVVLLYNCPNGCDDVAALLRAAQQRVPPDRCALVADAAPAPPAWPVIVTPDPELDVMVAAAAWGATWKSTCFDAPAKESLVAFLNAHLGSRGSAPARPVCP